MVNLTGPFMGIGWSIHTGPFKNGQSIPDRSWDHWMVMIHRGPFWNWIIHLIMVNPYRTVLGWMVPIRHQPFNGQSAPDRSCLVNQPDRSWDNPCRTVLKLDGQFGWSMRRTIHEVGDFIGFRTVRQELDGQSNRTVLSIHTRTVHGNWMVNSRHNPRTFQEIGRPMVNPYQAVHELDGIHTGPFIGQSRLYNICIIHTGRSLWELDGQSSRPFIGIRWSVNQSITAFAGIGYNSSPYQAVHRKLKSRNLFGWSQMSLLVLVNSWEIIHSSVKIQPPEWSITRDRS
ncbi:unnamed protein product [Acanthosepion pharaonis]|uniref:Uncharacterized protein n=1 Tax=Acanthosepion pharaonis TaxID=158019 RepID=A0A812B9D2_ACAPH|nr:unnamed protein product [Sepia pharaonis]